MGAEICGAELEMDCMRKFGRVSLAALAHFWCDREWVEHRCVRADPQAEQALHRAQATEPGRCGREAAGCVLGRYALRCRPGGGERHGVFFPSFKPLLKYGRPDRLVEGSVTAAVLGGAPSGNVVAKNPLKGRP